MVCPRCSTSYGDERSYCPSCGAAAPTLAANGAIPSDPGHAKTKSKTEISKTKLSKAKPGGAANDTTARREVDFVGRKVGGRYELMEMLGRGGMGIVYRATDTQLGEEIALKLLDPNLTQSAKEVERLKREIITARRITHPNVIRIHDFGIQEGEGFVSMELLDGGSLSDRLSDGAMPLDEAQWIALWLSEALAAVHDSGIIHRDIKPANVLFDLGGRPKLADFGLARLSGVISNTVGMTGTPLYMSPEMAGGGEISEKSDVYSLGIMLFEMFTGKVPFAAPNVLALVEQHLHDAPPSLKSLRPDLPEPVEEVVMHCLAKNQAVRPTAGEVAQVFRDELGVISGLTTGTFSKPKKKGPRAPDPSRTVESPPVTPPPTAVSGTAPAMPLGPPPTVRAPVERVPDKPSGKRTIIPPPPPPARLGRFPVNELSPEDVARMSAAGGSSEQEGPTPAVVPGARPAIEPTAAMPQVKAPETRGAPVWLAIALVVVIVLGGGVLLVAHFAHAFHP